MKPIEGDILSFSNYIELTAKPIAHPVLWRWTSIEAEAVARPHNPQGTLALSGGDVSGHGTVAPDVSLVIQVLKPGEKTESHRHSFWHLYIVHSGSGLLEFDKDGVSHRIEPGDTVFVPAWCYHAVGNNSDDETLRLHRIQNLPQVAKVGNLMREIGGQLQTIYADAGLASHR